MHRKEAENLNLNTNFMIPLNSIKCYTSKGTDVSIALKVISKSTKSNHIDVRK